MGYNQALKAKLNMRRPINTSYQSTLQSLTERYTKLAEIYMKSRLQDLQFTLVEASVKARADKADIEFLKRKKIEKMRLN